MVEVTARGAASRERDLTTGSIPRLVAILSVPGTASIAMMTFSGLIHAYWMGRIGGSALAAVAIASTLQFVLICPMMGLASGAVAVVARHVGAGEQRQADRATTQAVLLFLAIAVPPVLLGEVFAPTFLRWMGATGDLHASALIYARIIIGALFFIELPFTAGSIMRGAGHPEFSLYISLANVAVTILIETALGLRWGPLPPLDVRGVAWASALGGVAGWLVMLVALATGRGGVRLHLRDLRPDLSTMWRILRIALPATLQRLSPKLASALMVRLVTGFGTPVLTAFAIIGRIVGFLSSLGLGIGGAAGALVGQNLGAHKPERARRAVHVSAWLAIATTLLLTGLLNLFPQAILGLFAPNAAEMAAAIVAARFALLSAVAMALSNTLSSALLGAGDAVATMATSIVSLWVGQLGLAWLFSTPMDLGPAGIWAGMGLGYAVACVALILRLRRGRWQEIAV